MGKVNLVSKEFTKEEAEALLPALKTDTLAALDEVGAIEMAQLKWLKDHGMKREEAFAKSAEYRALAADRRSALFSWGARVQNLGIRIENPDEGAVILDCADGTRRWKAGDADYTFESTLHTEGGQGAIEV